MARRAQQLVPLALLLALVLSGAPSHAAEVQDSDEYADTYAAHLVVHKQIVDKDPQLAYPLVVQGRNATIVVTLHNTGTGPASDVKLVDTLPANSQLVEGTLTATFPKIASGSTAKNTYVIVFTSGGSMDVTFLAPATVTYKAEDDGDVQTGISSKAGVFVLTAVQQITRYALMAGTYASLGICRSPADWRNMAIFLGIVGTLLGANWSVKSMSARSTTVKRKKALQELEKDE